MFEKYHKFTNLYHKHYLTLPYCVNDVTTKTDKKNMAVEMPDAAQATEAAPVGPPMGVMLNKSTQWFNNSTTLNNYSI